MSRRRITVWQRASSGGTAGETPVRGSLCGAEPRRTLAGGRHYELFYY